MVNFTVRSKFKPEDRAKVEEAIKALTPLSQAEPGCVTYIPFWVEGEECTLMIWEQYADEQAAEFHRSSEHFDKWATGVLHALAVEREKEMLLSV